MIVCASPARSYPLQLSIHKPNAITHRKSPSRQGREGFTLLVVPPCFGQFSGKSTLIKRGNGRSRGNCSIQTPRRPSAHLLRGKLAALYGFPSLAEYALTPPAHRPLYSFTSWLQSSG